MVIYLSTNLTRTDIPRRPIKKLYQKALKVRQNYLREVRNAAVVVPDLDQMEITSAQSSKPVSSNVDFSAVPADAMNTLDFPSEWLKDPQIMQRNFNWTPWGQPSEQSTGLQSIPMSQNAWENFVVDFQGGDLFQGKEFDNDIYNFDIPVPQDPPNVL